MDRYTDGQRSVKTTGPQANSGGAQRGKSTKMG